MLEEQIDVLTKEIVNLTAAIKNLNKPAVVEKKQPEEKPVEIKEEPAETKGEIEITAQELQDICLAKVRKDPSVKKKIANIIGEFGGKLIKDVDESKFKELKAKLEAL